MAEADQISYRQGRRIAGTPRTSLALQAGSMLVSCLLMATSVGAVAGDSPPIPAHPIWTLVPTHIDRDKEHHIRLAPATEATDHMLLSVDRPIRLGADTTFLVAGQPTQIFGLKLPDPQKLCETPDRRRWACGVRAHAALTALLAARVLDCKRLSPIGASITRVSCAAGNSDIAERLVGEGWAEADPAAGIVLTSLQEAAEKAHRGIWSLSPPGT